MTRMTGPDCAVMCNLINTHTHAHLTGPRVVVFRKRSSILKPAETDVFSLVRRIAWSMLINETHTHTHTHTHSPPGSAPEGVGVSLYFNFQRRSILAGLVKIRGNSGPRVGAGVDLQEGGQSSGDHGTWIISRDTILTYFTKSGVQEPCGMTFSTCR